jgi:hypothetical protein
MDEQEFPKELTGALLPTLREYEAHGWCDIEIGWPTASHSATNTVFLHATSPSGKRVHAVFEDDKDLINRIDAFLNSSD